MQVLLATKGAAHSAAALHFTGELAALAEIEVTVLTVVKGVEEQLVVGELLERIVGELRTVVDRVQTVVRLGDAAAEILREAQQGSYDLILIGQRPAHGLLTRLRGSVTQHVIAHLPCPVAVVKGPVRPLRQILVCESGEQEAPLLERFQETLPQFFQSEMAVTCLHIMSQISAAPGIEGTQLRAEADELIEAHTPEGEWLERDLEILQRAHLPHQPKVRHGLVVDEIVAEAQSGDYDLVVIGAHRAGGWPTFLLDDLARQIVEEVDRPVLVIP